MQVPIQTQPTVEPTAGNAQPFGAPAVEPMQDFTGKQLMELGKTQATAGAAMIRIADRLQGEIDDVKVAERVNGLTTELDNIATEFGQLNGKTAFDAKPVFDRRVNEAVAKYNKDYDNDVQKTLFMAKAAVLTRTANSQINRHSLTEFGKYDLVESKSTVQGLVLNMAKSWETRGQVDAQGKPTGDFAKYQAAALLKVQDYANKIGIPVYEAVDPRAPLFSSAQSVVDYLKKNPEAEITLNGQTFRTGKMANGDSYYNWNGDGSKAITEKFFTDRVKEAYPEQVKKWAAGEAQPVLPVAPDKLPQKKTAAFEALEREIVWEPAAVSVTQSMMNAGQFGSAKTFLEGEWKAGHIDAKAYQTLNDNVTTADLTVQAEDKATSIFNGKKVVSGVTYAPPMANLTVSSGFGPRAKPNAKASAMHNGVDYAAPEGTPIYATADGKVEKAWNDEQHGGGNSVVLNHGEKRTTGYAHMLRFVVQPGDNVKQGQLIGYVGQTGNATGPHLHFTMTDVKGNRIDPTKIQFGVATNGGQVIAGPESPADKQAAIDAIPDLRLRKMVQQSYNQKVTVQEATEKREKDANWQTAMDVAFAGDGNQWQALSRNNPGLWNSLTYQQQATLMNGKPKGDDPDTMIKLLSNPNLWEADKLKEYRHLISQSSYERFFTLGNGPKAADNVRAATFDNDMFEATMLSAKMPELVDPKNPNSKQEAINLRNKFKVLIDVEQTTKKRELTRDEKQKLLDQIVLDKVALPGWVKDIGEQKPVFRLTPKEQEEAFVMWGGKKVLIASIGAEDRKQIMVALSAAGKAQTEENIVDYYMRNKNPGGTR